MPHHAIIFDLDGTLLNTLDDLANALNRVLGKHHLPLHTVDEYRYFIGDGAVVLTERALPEALRDEGTIRAYLKEFREDYRENCFVETKPYDGMYPLLEKLTERGIKTAVLSNKHHEETLRCVERFFKSHRFEVVLGMSDGTPRKPDPTGALKISEAIGIPPSEFIFLGDTAVDMKTAIGARMHPVGAAWGFRTEEELRESGAWKTIERPEALLDLIDLDH